MIRFMHEQKPYEDEESYKQERAPYNARRILIITSSTQITEDEIKYVVE